jgi:nucleoside-diphosphate-sugar epimerase
VVRPPIVFGPRDTDVLEFFKAVKRGLIPGIGCKDHFAGFVYVEDLCEGLVLAAEKNEALGQTYYLVNEGNCTWKRFGRTVAEALGKTAIPFPVPFVLLALIVFMNDAWARARKRATILNRQKLPEYRARFWGCDGSKAALELGFRPSYTLPQAVVKTGSWYRSMGWL